MKDKRADISQIQDYLKGKLESKAMHQLEREAQDDPFLADALDGYASSADQEQNLETLRERLQQRTQTKVRRILPWSTMAVAASVIGFFVVAGLLFMRDNPDKPTTLTAVNQPAKLSAPVEPSTPTAKQTNKRFTSAPIVTEKHSYTNQRLPTPRSLREVAIQPGLKIEQADSSAGIVQQGYYNYTAQTPVKMDSANYGYSAGKRQDTVLGGANIAINKKPSAVTMLRSKAEGVTYKERDRQSASATAALMAANLPTNISGKITDDAGAPIPGATVQIAGKSIGTTTDANGRFTLHDVSPQDQVVYNFIGFDKKVLPAKPGDSVKVALHESAAALSEVVVVANAKRSGSKAEPKTGWKAYQEYLKREAIVGESQKAGNVQLSITFEPNGQISNFKVLKSLSPAADKKAIDLVQNGPNWFGNLNGKPEVVKLTVKFSRDE
ncbi:carboxypeptidase-like regulatory domain-containing protein [Mucilaginibacter sp. 21P]|uniref:carboxypeptidase-like regulatory domain-containing protein n=1 Tax=Mucilaginibacter sp. 21P TaxID=2778902 RepID=UPI001C57BDDB|nr:carboxypeptidase-like regulatory domain-containing protein [Mucilaginibacter sp. 21P]QXV65748.1 carboxypeptidase-like regulatory domain-containing protein [Mucilaginibacter sp. 21P]